MIWVRTLSTAPVEPPQDLCGDSKCPQMPLTVDMLSGRLGLGLYGGMVYRFTSFI